MTCLWKNGTNVVNGKIPWNADLYDLNETAVDDVEFAIMLIGATPRKVLEIACGSGRFRFLWQKQDTMSPDLILMSICWKRSRKRSRMKRLHGIRQM